MPRYKGHLLGAAVLYVLLLACFSLYYIPVYMLICWLAAMLSGALFPDIDIKSKGQQLFYKIFCALILVSIVVYKKHTVAAYMSLCAFAPLLFKHRGIFHNIWFLLACTGAVTYALVQLMPPYQDLIVTSACFFSLGFISHLWLDLGLKRMLKLRR